MKLPGPDHPITVTPNTRRVRVTFGGHTIADTTRALTLNEAGYRAVHYIKTTHHTACPYKGDASYFTISANGKAAENAAWTYETPFPAMKDITGYLAFYPNKVEKIEEL